MLSLMILLIVFFLIAVRQIGNLKLQIWQIMLFGALASIITGEISIISAFQAIKFDVLFFLFGMFVIGQALEDSGYLSHLAYKLFKKARNMDELILLILFGAGISSAILMNDTLAIIGTPVVLLLAKNHKINAKVLLLALCFSVTIGSDMSPIGNPQNLLIAMHLKEPFFTFLKYLFIPSIINLFVTFFILKIFFKEKFNTNILKHSEEPIKDKTLKKLSKLSLILVVFLIILKIIFVYLNINFDFKLTYIALISSLPIIIYRLYCLITGKKFHILTKIDWHTLIFFTSMFILMQSVWDDGFFQELIKKTNIDLGSIEIIYLISVFLSQFISNVPLVALYLPLILNPNIKQMIALASGSTIAGNLLILGA
ncbi:MAG: SLC13 family permease, partial [Candidatus Woesearchaeota archaeon]